MREHEPEQTMTIRLGGKKWTLPRVLPFGGAEFGSADVLMPHGWHFYVVIGYRSPMKNEYYLSGAKVQVWRAPNDLHDGPFLVVRKTTPAKKVSMWVSDEMPACPNCDSNNIE